MVFAILVWASSSFASCESELIHSEKKLVETLVELNMDWAEGLFQEIVKKHPIEKSEYIFVGRSPALLAAYLEVQKMLFPRIQSWTLPISLKGQRDIPREQLKDRFEKMMSSYGISSTGRIKVFIDFVADGKTFKTLDLLLSETGIDGEFFAFSHFKPDFGLERLNHKSSWARIPLEVEIGINEVKWIAPYKESLPIEIAEAGDLERAPKGISERFQEAVEILNRKLFEDF
ncbi:MAG TPA: hypothetical protein DCL41_10700 [Bdellovibrionales bacterium]|nr:hypothetical protein [Bdellovibrionales bacterium]